MGSALFGGGSWCEADPVGGCALIGESYACVQQPKPEGNMSRVGQGGCTAKSCLIAVALPRVLYGCLWLSMVSELQLPLT